MGDISIVHPFCFLSRKQNAIKDERLEAKIKDLIANYNCFRDECIIMQPPLIHQNNKTPFKGHAHSYIHKPYRNHRHHSNNFINRTIEPLPPRKRLLNTNQSSVERSINTLFNKISNRNYLTIRSKLINICSDQEQNIGLVVRSILEKCCSEEAFVSVYIGIIHDLQKMYANFVNNELSNIVQLWSQGFESDLNTVAELEALTSGINNNVSYDDVCVLFKTKNRMYAQNRILMYLNRQGMIQINMRDHVNRLLTIVFKEFNDAKDEQYSHSWYRIEVMSQMILDTISECSEESSSIPRDDIIEFQERICENEYIKAITRFKWLDIRTFVVKKKIRPD